MNLLLLFDHRFFRAKNGIIFSDKSYHYEFFKSRYLQTFESMSILARVADVGESENTSPPTEGDGVKVIALRDWLGPWGHIQNRRTVIEAALREVRRPSAVLMIAREASARLHARACVRKASPLRLR